MIGHALAAFITTLLGLLTAGAVALLPPGKQRKTCDPGWYVEGVPMSGRTRCRPAPPPNCGEPRGPYQQPCPDDPREKPIAIVCAGNTRPIALYDGRTIACHRR